MYQAGHSQDIDTMVQDIVCPDTFSHVITGSKSAIFPAQIIQNFTCILKIRFKTAS